MKSMKSFLTVLMIIIVIGILYNKIRPRNLSPKWYINKTKWDLTGPQMATIESAIDYYQLRTGQYPNTLEDLITVPAGLENVWTGPYLEERSLYDPWDRLYIYETDSNNPDSYSLICYGADGLPGGKGKNEDIENFIGFN